jgi:hypothetical protein
MTNTESSPAKVGFRPEFIGSRALTRMTFPHGWLVEHCLVAGQPCVVGGPKKTLKTSVVIDLAISLGTGTPFLNHFDVPARVRAAVLSGESGAAGIQDAARRVAAAKDVSLEKGCWVDWCFRLPRLNRRSDRRLLANYLADRGTRVVVIDPLYLCLLDGTKGLSAANLYEVGPLLRQAAEACLDAGATPVFVHHATKGGTRRAGGAEPLDLDDLAFSGIGEFARQWLLLCRRRPYQPGTGDHQLLLNAGGSAGHSACYEVDVREGVLAADFSGRRWKVTVRPAGERAHDS